MQLLVQELCYLYDYTRSISNKYKNYTLLNHAFASNVNISSKYIKAWVYGHTHEKNINGIYYCNPIGYPGENSKYSLENLFIL